MLVTAIRHGQAEHNPYMRTPERYIGEHIRDPHLTDFGKRQAIGLDNKIISIEKKYMDKYNELITTCKTIILSSPLRRALETLEIGFPHGDDVIVMKDLQEFGMIPCDTGTKKSKLVERFPEYDFLNLSEDWYKSKHKNNDSKIDEIKSMLNYIYDNTEYDHVIIISHEGVLYSLLESLFENCEIKTYYMWENKDNNEKFLSHIDLLK